MGIGYASNQHVTFLNSSSGRKYLEVNANFSGTDVDFSNLKIEISDVDKKIAVNTSGVSGLYGTHTLWLPKTGDSGVYVCPSALTVTDVSTSCSGKITFAGAFPETQSGITVSVDGSDWKIEGLAGSGAGEGGGRGAVPEFSTITLLLALAVVGGGLVLIRSRQ